MSSAELKCMPTDGPQCTDQWRRYLPMALSHCVTYGTLMCDLPLVFRDIQYLGGIVEQSYAGFNSALLLPLRGGGGHSQNPHFIQILNHAGVYET